MPTWQEKAYIFFFFQAIKVEQKMKQDAQVILYRNYRHGDLPDIQIAYSSLIAPLQALAHVSRFCSFF